VGPDLVRSRIAIFPCSRVAILAATGGAGSARVDPAGLVAEACIALREPDRRPAVTGGIAGSIYQPLRQGKRDNRQRLGHGEVIGTAEPNDNQIVIAQFCQLTGRRDKPHRLLASVFGVIRLQPEDYLAVQLRAELGYPTGLSQYLGHN